MLQIRVQTVWFSKEWDFLGMRMPLFGSGSEDILSLLPCQKPPHSVGWPTPNQSSVQGGQVRVQAVDYPKVDFNPGVFLWGNQPPLGLSPFWGCQKWNPGPSDIDSTSGCWMSKCTCGRPCGCVAAEVHGSALEPLKLRAQRHRQ